MSIRQTGSGSGARRLLPRWSVAAAAQAWLYDRSDHSRAQRMAGNAFLIRLASGAIAFLSQPLFARWMGAHEFGIYAYVWTWVLLVGSVIDFGFETSAQRFIPEYANRKALDLLRGFVVGSSWLVVALSTMVAALAAAIVWAIEPRISQFIVLPLYLACMALPLYGLTSVQSGIARSYDWINLALMPAYVVRPFVIIVLMVAANLMGFPASAATVMTASVIAVWATAIVQLLVLDRALRTKIEPGRKAYEIKQWLKTSLPISLGYGFFFLLTYIDVLVLQEFRPPQEVGVYFAATKVLALVAFVYYSVSAAFAHRFATYHVAGDRHGLAAFFASSIRWTFWPSLAAALLILTLGRPILWLFGAEFPDGYPVLFLLAIGVLARAAVGPAERLLNMLGEQRACALVYAGVFALNLVGCLVLIPRLGAVGAALSTSAAVVVESIALFWVIKRRLGLHGFVWSRPRQSTLK